jgi:hypothetical protein
MSAPGQQLTETDSLHEPRNGNYCFACPAAAVAMYFE